MSIVKSAIPSQGFDVNQPLNASQAAAFKANGYDFCIRYLPRTVALIKGNLTHSEIDIILNAGLSLGAVQHVSNDGWVPSKVLGTQYGQYAATHAEIIGLPKGINVWLDLEMPSAQATAQDVIDYCVAWHEAVNAGGYVPGIYVGYAVILSSSELYNKLPFKHYWKAYNGPDVAVRGYQIIQHTQKTLNGISFDPNTIQADNKGDLPILLFPS